MQKPLNTSERIKRYLIFLALYIACTALLIFTIYFNYQVPVVENHILRETILRINQEREYQHAFQQQIAIVKSSMQKINDPGQHVAFIDQQVVTALSSIREHISGKIVSSFQLYDDVIQICLELQQAKQQLRELSTAQQSLLNMKIEQDKLKQRLDNVNRDLDNCRMMLLNSRSSN
ncbi:type VI secretion system TssO [Chitinophaga sp. Hz27]|uniref:type VI secretion system TssO n=1 Tax=Chitinophaga sp. Hz27 TaxID=3347169 RepID=UPI0035DE9FA7